MPRVRMLVDVEWEDRRGSDQSYVVPADSALRGRRPLTPSRITLPGIADTLTA